MNQIKQLSMLLLGVVLIASNVCVGDTLQIKPTRIEVFKEDKILAIDDAAQYQIGNVHNKWSRVYDVVEKGFNVLDAVAATNAGIFFIGKEKQIHKKNDYKLLNDTHIAGLIILVDSNNRTIREWRTDVAFSDVSVYHNQLTLTSADGIYTLNTNGDITLIENNDERQWLTPIRDGEGDLILCNSPFGLKDEQSGWCSKADDWIFGGSWYTPTTTIGSTPIMCGSWMISSRQEQLNSPLLWLEVHDINSGRRIKKIDLPGFQHFFCINESEVMTDISLQSYVLPDLKPGNRYSCNNDEMIVSIKKDNDKSICLTANGSISLLKRNK